MTINKKMEKMEVLSPVVPKNLIDKSNKNLRKKTFPKINENERLFISFLSHEVRNPLANINLSAEMLKGVCINVEQKKYLNIILRNSKRISELITQLLTYERAEKEEECHSVNSLIDEALTIVDDRIKLKSIHVIKSFSNDDFIIVANEAKIKIALTNILINAIEAMPVVTGVLKLNGKAIHGMYEVIIEDNGCGISNNHLHSIFDLGFTDKPGGLGFGLQITKTILQANNVGIEVESNEGVFTRFTLLFNKIKAFDNAIKI